MDYTRGGSGLFPVFWGSLSPRRCWGHMRRFCRFVAGGTCPVDRFQPPCGAGGLCLPAFVRGWGWFWACSSCWGRVSLEVACQPRVCVCGGCVCWLCVCFWCFGCGWLASLWALGVLFVKVGGARKDGPRRRTWVHCRPCSCPMMQMALDGGLLRGALGRQMAL